MSFRLLIAGISHETNTYCQGTTGLDEFWVLRGERIARRLRGTRTEIGGMLLACEELDARAIPVLVSGATPSGIIAADAYGALKDEIVSGIRAVPAFDAVALALHGAGVVEGIDDLEGDLAGAVRDVVGDEVPVVACLDLHGNVTQKMADLLDVGLGCHEYPHTDMYERGAEAVRLVPALLDGTLQPVSHVETVPILLPTSTTLFGPARSMNKLCWQLETREGVVDCTFFHGFPYTDTPLVGCHIYATTNGDRELARSVAREAARALWERRDEFRQPSLSCKEAIERALAVDGRPVVINETSDNPGGGSPGDGTHLLRAMVNAELSDACFGFICDPEVAAAAHAAGVGETIEVELGGKTDELHGPPLAVTAYVKTLSDGRFELQHMLKGLPADLGPMARLRVGRIDVLVASRRNQTFDAEVFRLHGIDVERVKIVALKSSNHFRAGFQELAHEIITADPPGLTTHQIQVFPRKRAPGPLWPLEPAEY